MTFWLTTGIIAVTYIGIALGDLPGLRVNRTTISLIGVGVLLAARLLAFQQIGSLLDINTLVLLFGMMIINANLQLSGFFGLAACFILRWTRSPRMLLALEILVVGLLSALFLNDTICLMLTPFILDITAAVKRNPIPYLIALATAANIGSVATLTGNPQNMIIGIASGISYLHFLASMAPIALLGLGSIWLVLVVMYRQEFSTTTFDQIDISTPRTFRPLLIKSLIVTGGLLIAFVVGTPIAEAAFIAGCILLLTRRVHPEKVMTQVDWNLLVFFACLFILTGVIELNPLTTGIFNFLAPFLDRGAAALSAITVILSNLVSNVPAVMLLLPAATHPQAGPILALSSTLAGNLLIVGSIANIIVVEQARRLDVRISWGRHARVGIPVTLVTLALAAGWLAVRAQF